MSRTESYRAFARELPGGGRVAIDVTSKRSMWRRGERYAGRVVVEECAHWPGEQRSAAVVAEADGVSVESVVQQLLPAAQCNAAIGSALLRLDAV